MKTPDNLPANLAAYLTDRTGRAIAATLGTTTLRPFPALTAARISDFGEIGLITDDGIKGMTVVAATVEPVVPDPERLAALLAHAPRLHAAAETVADRLVRERQNIASAVRELRNIPGLEDVIGRLDGVGNALCEASSALLTPIQAIETEGDKLR